MHIERFLWNTHVYMYRLPSSVLIAQAVFLFERGNTHTLHTDMTDATDTLYPTRRLLPSLQRLRR